MELMAMLEREFYRSARGPAPADEDVWRLVFDQNTKRLFVRHEWQSTGHAGVEDYTVDEFLTRQGAAADALLTLLFDRTTVDA
jgi:hypothetical protein